MRKTKKMLSVIFILGVFICLASQTVCATERIQANLPKINLNSTVVAFGGYQWYVVGYNGGGLNSSNGTMTLLPVKNIGKSVFGSNLNYYGSTLAEYLKNQANKFDAGERDIMVAKNGEYLWALSSGDTGKLSLDVLRTGEEWWLNERAIAPYMNSVATIDYTGRYFYYGGCSHSDPTSSRSVRPGLTINTSKILFSSSATGDKTNATGTILTDVQATTSPIKLTLQNSMQLLSLKTKKVRAQEGDLVSVEYFSATTGPNQYISAIITDNTDKIVFYGKLKAVSDETNEKGVVKLRLPLGFDSSIHKLKLFSEQINGDNKTDYASSAVSVEVDSGYTIIAAAGKNGKITPSETVSIIGVDQTYTMIPDEGYSVDEVFVDGILIGNDNLQEGSGNVKKYTFKDVMSDHSIMATFTAELLGAGTAGIYKEDEKFGVGDILKLAIIFIVFLVSCVGAIFLVRFIYRKRKEN